MPYCTRLGLIFVVVAVLVEFQVVTNGLILLRQSNNVLGIIYQKLDFIFRVKPKTLVGHDDINVYTCVTL
ncbi:hypothetical protein Gasu2_30490 [Galdieria sulphuraria]|uniref:Uncharacterized protein n=1 Tax=Galdieria sulphuraria TaxID=130081 RepID=M2XQY8_GALSU|nr:uncharacterized protein Gasu_62920 [Galdieria sulphuraria]EME26058.1 hypothetical protein Gasu_62920 [Galdieria sulphuraria]GJD05607.1 hypothetical protein Gasu2_00670 [Galdieria sulphuraria]GJD06287.1 hypothetical protein Gasu2_07120 [Galdieria sulphuraria]GJD06876.1 hypothetical protein Gasu2_12660 [Galdieria sulphuraria]GJD08763.1 hypothetical protein Gasu2_30490 [Galdieria sulphuraria]|eukprot:XP_005702578.1 hypothetical protein Gasu_62920 [Galdieria sulphuraria]